MQLSDFDYDLPQQQIAQYPLAQRSHSRLLLINREKKCCAHAHFYDLVHHLNEGDLLVFNNTRVIPARLFGVKPSGGKVEILIERVLDRKKVLAHLKGARIRVGTLIFIDESHYFRVLEHAHLYRLEYMGSLRLSELMDQFGHVPLPPYMLRPDEGSDRERYQTVYSQTEGSVAAPTAGLHFDETLLESLRHKGVRFAWVTLHVGAGTFQPVKVANILEHRMHSEFINLPEETVLAILEAKARGGRVIAVGTTSARTLESVFFRYGRLRAYSGETDLFIYPGFHYQVLDALITNFHQPKSSLLMLVAAFMGRDFMWEAYQLAIKAGYRFLSYGDAMFIE